MSIDRIVMAFAGSVVLISVLLAHFVNTNWLWLTVFCGRESVAGVLHRFLPSRGGPEMGRLPAWPGL